MQKRLWIVLCLFVSLTVAAQSPHKSASESSCARAREVLEAGIKAMGGLDALRAINNISREMSDAKSVIERAAVATHTLRPDALSRSPRAPVIETVKGKRVFDDGAHRVELYEFSNPHCAEMIIAWLPKEKVLFEADMLDITYPDHIGQGGEDTAALLG